MKVAKVKITNFKCYEETFTLALDDGLNVIVGTNESGKTTILEAIYLALTGLLHVRPGRTSARIHPPRRRCREAHHRDRRPVPGAVALRIMRDDAVRSLGSAR